MRQRLHAKVPVIDDSPRGLAGPFTQYQPPAVRVKFDCIGFSESLHDAVLRRLAARRRIRAIRPLRYALVRFAGVRLLGEHVWTGIPQWHLQPGRMR